MTGQPGNQLDPLEWSKWRGNMEQRVSTVEKDISIIKTDVKILPDRIESRMEKVFNGRNKQAIDAKWLLEKIALPLIIGGGSVAAAVAATLQYLK